MSAHLRNLRCVIATVLTGEARSCMRADMQAAHDAFAALYAARELIPSEADMIENNPDEGPRLFCCRGDINYNFRGNDTVTHAPGCWYPRLRHAFDLE